MEEENRDSVVSLSIINFLIGAWLVISPYILTYSSGSAKWNQTAFGIAILFFSAVRFLAPRASWASFVNGVIGLWMIIAPFILNYNRSVAYWNEIIFGALIALIGFSNSAINTTARHHHTTV